MHCCQHQNVCKRDVEKTLTSASIKSDFYAYACGGWIKKTSLPKDRARYTR